MLSSPDVLLELEWYGAGAAYFRFDLAGAESVIRNARLRCSAASMHYTYDIKTIEHLLLQAGFDPGPADGLWGAATLGAPARFQAPRGPPPSAKIDMQTQPHIAHSGPGPHPQTNVTVRRESTETPTRDTAQ